MRFNVESYFNIFWLIYPWSRTIYDVFQSIKNLLLLKQVLFAKIRVTVQYFSFYTKSIYLIIIENIKQEIFDDPNNNLEAAPAGGGYSWLAPLSGHHPQFPAANDGQ